MSEDLLGDTARRWAALGDGLPAGVLRVMLTDVDGVITRGEGEPIDLDILARLAEINAAALRDPLVPALALCTGRQAPYVELMAQAIGCFLPCIFEHGAGLFFPMAFRYEFDPRHVAQLGGLREALRRARIVPERAFVQPGKEASMTLYPLANTSLDDLFEAVAAVVADTPFDLARNVRGLELRPRGIDKGVGAQRVADHLGISFEGMTGVGDSDPDLTYLRRVAFSTAPANATSAVRENVEYVATRAFGEGLLEIVSLVDRQNRQTSLTVR